MSEARSITPCPDMLPMKLIRRAFSSSHAKGSSYITHPGQRTYKEELYAARRFTNTNNKMTNSTSDQSNPMNSAGYALSRLSTLIRTEDLVGEVRRRRQFTTPSKMRIQELFRSRQARFNKIFRGTLGKILNIYEIHNDDSHYVLSGNWGRQGDSPETQSSQWTQMSGHSPSADSVSEPRPRKPIRRRSEGDVQPMPPAPAHSTFHLGVFADKNYPSRRTMEDTHVVMYDFGGVKDCGLFAVFDGHGGKSASKWCADHYPTLLADLLKDNSENLAEVLSASFTQIDGQLSAANGIHSGCTAVVCLLSNANGERWLHTANVGDARAVLFRDGQALRLSHDHKGSDPVEQRRVRNAGGFISNQRVNGLLAVTRSLGDREMKDFVIGLPYTSQTKISLVDTLLVLACDGIWDILSDQEVCEMAQSFTDPEAAAKAIATRAMAEGSSDNISIIVVYLQRRDNNRGEK